MTDFRHARRSAANPERGPTPRDDGDVAAVVSEAVGRLRANGHLYFELRRDEPSGIAVAVRHHRSEDVALVEYGERFYTDDPLTAPFRSWLSRGGTSGRGPGIVALGELPRASRTAYEDRFLRRAGIADVLGIGIPASIDGRPRVFCFGFHRSAADPGFAAGEKRALARLADGLRLRAENLALREVLASRPATAPVMTASVVAVAGLTEREREVAGLLMAGHGNRWLARELGLTVNTIENHLRSIYAKLGVRSRGRATARLLGGGTPPA